MRNDSSLITGMSSAQSRRVAQKQQKAELEKQHQGARLKPHAELIMEWINKEKDDIVNIEKLVLDVSNEKNLQAQIIAIQMHLHFLNGLKSRAAKLLRAEEKA